MPGNAYIKTYGCQMNEHDTQRMYDMLDSLGYAAVSTPEEADVILVNTCSVRANPENKVYSFLGALRPFKQRNPALIVGVAGCVAQQEGEKILQRERCVDLVFGPDNLFRLGEMLAEVAAGRRLCDTHWAERGGRVQNFVPEEWVERGHVEGIRAYIAITKGCNNLCSFCIVPDTRGSERSRPLVEVVEEVREADVIEDIRKGILAGLEVLNRELGKLVEKLDITPDAPSTIEHAGEQVAEAAAEAVAGVTEAAADAVEDVVEPKTE